MTAVNRLRIIAKVNVCSRKPVRMSTGKHVWVLLICSQTVVARFTACMHKCANSKSENAIIAGFIPNRYKHSTLSLLLRVYAIVTLMHTSYYRVN